MALGLGPFAPVNLLPGSLATDVLKSTYLSERSLGVGVMAYFFAHTATRFELCEFCSLVVSQLMFACACVPRIGMSHGTPAALTLPSAFRTPSSHGCLVSTSGPVSPSISSISHDMTGATSR